MTGEQRNAARALRLADGTYLIRGGCCRPELCRPRSGFRCCRSMRCGCDWPMSTWDSKAPVNRTRVAVVSASIGTGLGICAGMIWLAASAVAWVAAHGVLVLVLLGLAVVLSAGIGHKCVTTVSTTVTHRH